MSGEHEILHSEEETRSATQSQVLSPAPSVSVNELGEVEVLFHAAESASPSVPSIERWTQFNEQVMEKAITSLQQRPGMQDRWQRIYDRFTASDSRWKERLQVLTVVVAVTVLMVIIYLVM